MFEVICITFAFFFGLAVRQIGLPPLVGFLTAGFAINAFREPLGLPTETGAILDYIAHLGVLLLLFAVGLKLKLGQLVQPHVVGTTLLHFAISTAIFTPGLAVFLGLDWTTALLLAMALGFSSTVLSAKLLETKRELAAFHGRIAIGILVIQDLVALVVLSAWSGEIPSFWALLVLALPLLRPVAYWLLDFTGHDELLILMGMLLALVVGGMGFEAVGLSSELGALLMGVLLSGHKRAQELSDSLWGLKEIFLVGFFLEIGMSGLPDMNAILFALAMVLVLPLKGVLFFVLLIAFRLRARNAFLAGLSLTAYSEFGLIVAAGVLPDWLVPLAIAVSLSFVVAAPLNRLAHPIFQRFETFLTRFEFKRRHPDEIPVAMGDARVIIFGMGRTGLAAYDTLREHTDKLIGLDADTYRVQTLRAAGRNVALTDAEDANFWRGVDIGGIEAVVLAMDDIEAKLNAARQLRALGFTGPIIAHALYEDHVERIMAAGANHTYLTMQEAGMSLGQRAWTEIEEGEDA
ncbi:cation:proton antiporter [Pelagibacterium halotolerans]|uniref:cation:proton antiporter domain-containing protein n=1 Tax=Pelagibacterium halotolerans TaxID=531813 RepID=UPI00384E8484